MWHNPFVVQVVLFSCDKNPIVPSLIYCKTIFKECSVFFQIFGVKFGTFSFFMHGQFQFLSPHGPCIICSATRAYPKGSNSGSGISADIHKYIVYVVISQILV
jgi:hypothetical protein